VAQTTCSTADCTRDAYARGLCEPHYRRLLSSGADRIKTPKRDSCSFPGCTASHRAHGLCSRHYSLQRNRGSADAQPIRVRGRVCSVPGCEERASAQGWCPAHYQRAKRSGGDPGSAIERAEERACNYCAAPFSSANLSRKYCSDECAYIGKSLREAYRRYGIDMQEYRRLWLKQKGNCAVCRQPERTERNRLLTIDHDHVSGHVRGLLCSQCNRAIGLLQDDPKVIAAAAAYVRRHRQMPLFT